MSCRPLPGWLRGKRCIYALDTFDGNPCVWRCLAIYKRLARGETNRVQKRNRNVALNLERKYYGDKKLKKGTCGLKNMSILKELQNTTMRISCCMNQRRIQGLSGA